MIVRPPRYERRQPIAGDDPTNGEPWPPPSLRPDGGRGNLSRATAFHAFPQHPVIGGHHDGVAHPLFLVRVSFVLQDFPGLNVAAMIRHIHCREIRRTRQSLPINLVRSGQSRCSLLTVHHRILATVRCRASGQWALRRPAHENETDSTKTLHVRLAMINSIIYHVTGVDHKPIVISVEE